MDTEPPRLVLAVSALAGAVVWGLYTLVMATATGQPVGSRDVARALATVVAGIAVGVLAAYFLGPVLQGYLPEQLRDPHAVGFAIGAGAWEAAPFALGLLRRRAKGLGKGGGR